MRLPKVPLKFLKTLVRRHGRKHMHAPLLKEQRSSLTRSCTFPIILLCCCSLTWGVSTSAQTTAVTLPRNIGQLVSESQMVVQGWVTSVALERHGQLENLMTVVVSLQVEETLKGDAAKTFTFQQAVIDRRDQRDRMGYRTGQHLLLILIKPNPYGLTSPAGMEQGRFRIELLAGGKQSATNGFANAGLFRGLNSQLQAKGIRVAPEVDNMIAKPAAGPVSLEHLKSLIRAIVAADSKK